MKTKKLVCYNCGGHGFITTTYENGQTSAICPVCGGIGSHEIQMTHADRIRAMSDEELAKAIFNWFCVKEHCDMCVPEMRTPKKCNGRCTSGILRWLQQPAEDKNGV